MAAVVILILSSHVLLLLLDKLLGLQVLRLLHILNTNPQMHIHMLLVVTLRFEIHSTPYIVMVTKLTVCIESGFSECLLMAFSQMLLKPIFFLKNSLAVLAHTFGIFRRSFSQTLRWLIKLNSLGIRHVIAIFIRMSLPTMLVFHMLGQLVFVRKHLRAFYGHFSNVVKPDPEPTNILPLSRLLLLDNALITDVLITFLLDNCLLIDFCGMVPDHHMASELIFVLKQPYANNVSAYLRVFPDDVVAFQVPFRLLLHLWDRILWNHLLLMVLLVVGHQILQSLELFPTKLLVLLSGVKHEITFEKLGLLQILEAKLEVVVGEPHLFESREVTVLAFKPSPVLMVVVMVDCMADTLNLFKTLYLPLEIKRQTLEIVISSLFKVLSNNLFPFLN